MEPGTAGGSPEIVYTGSDDTLIKVWDRRTVGGAAEAPTSSHDPSDLGGGDFADSPAESSTKAVGVLAGHTEGVAHLDARGDGRYLCSNGKDQTLRIWDVRMMHSTTDFRRMRQTEGQNIAATRMDWDYRWMPYPATGYDVRHPLNCSVHAFRGHSVLQTLIRAYFSPGQSTGHRYVYTGGQDGHVRIFDILTGEVTNKLVHHQAPVRDVAWHPTDAVLNSVSWDGTVVEWSHSADASLAAA